MVPTNGWMRFISTDALLDFSVKSLGRSLTSSFMGRGFVHSINRCPFSLQLKHFIPLGAGFDSVRSVVCASFYLLLGPLLTSCCGISVYFRMVPQCFRMLLSGRSLKRCNFAWSWIGYSIDDVINNFVGIYRYTICHDHFIMIILVERLSCLPCSSFELLLQGQFARVMIEHSSHLPGDLLRSMRHVRVL